MDAISTVVLTELVTFTEEAAKEEYVAPVFKLAGLTKLYMARMEKLGAQMNQRAHATRLKEYSLTEEP